MEFQELVEKLKQEEATPEEVLKAVKQRRRMLKKVKEYQRKTYKKITISIRKDEISMFREYFPNLDEKYIVYSLAIRKLLLRIPQNI